VAPSIAGFVLRLDPDGVTMWVDVDPERVGAWRRAPYYPQIKSWSGAIVDGRGVVVVHDDRGVFVVFPETELFILQPPRGAQFKAAIAWARTGGALGGIMPGPVRRRAA
jgi:hypothetical protein